MGVELKEKGITLSLLNEELRNTAGKLTQFYNDRDNANLAKQQAEKELLEIDKQKDTVIFQTKEKQKELAKLEENIANKKKELINSQKEFIEKTKIANKELFRLNEWILNAKEEKTALEKELSRIEPNLTELHKREAALVNEIVKLNTDCDKAKFERDMARKMFQDEYKDLQGKVQIAVNQHKDIKADMARLESSKVAFYTEVSKIRNDLIIYLIRARKYLNKAFPNLVMKFRTAKEVEELLKLGEKMEEGVIIRY